MPVLPQGLPPLQSRVDFDLTTVGLALFAMTGVCFAATGVWNPGVPSEPKPPPDAPPDALLPHPGNKYSLSRDTNRYVHGFDHFCEFVGNDIGKGNLGCFVAFLVLLSLLSTYVVVLSSWQVVAFLSPPDAEWHVLPDVWRIALAVTVVATLAFCLSRCLASQLCSSVLPLIMMMPGATCGAALIVLVLAATVLLPLTSDMMSDVTRSRNPTSFFLILPCLCFAVLFWGMSIHWVVLISQKLTQKLWLRSQGYKRPARKPDASDATALV